MTGRGPGVRPVLMSVGLHLAILVPVVAFTRAPRPTEFETIRITLVSMPAPVEATRPAPPEPSPEPAPEPEQPAPEPPAEQPRPEPVPEQPRPTPPPPRPAEPPRTERPTPPRPTPPPATTPATPPAANPTPGADGLNIQTEGRDFPFPEYLNNVIVQVHRYFRWTDGGTPRATIYFEIMSDGSVRGLRVVRPSGNVRFDFAVQGAVETAGNRGAFGPLPDAFAGGSLPVQLEVEPPR
jgi:outer membrane biosynthesis protein TonB